jgi:hypothetical protein
MQKWFSWFRVLILAVLLPLAITLPIVAESQTANAQATLTVDCANDLKTFCSNVSPGKDRLVACLIAYEDKIHPRCSLTAHALSGRLSDRAKGMQGFIKSCSSDIKQYCSELAVGGGRILDCLKENKATLAIKCRNLMP